MLYLYEDEIVLQYDREHLKGIDSGSGTIRCLHCDYSLRNTIRVVDPTTDEAYSRKKKRQVATFSRIADIFRVCVLYGIGWCQR